MQPTAEDVLRAFRIDEPQLFIAAASITVGLVAVGFSLIRRRFDRLLSFFAWFAVVYGARLWMQSDILRLMQRPSPFLEKVRMALNFFVAVPAFQFFAATGLSWPHRQGDRLCRMHLRDGSDSSNLSGIVDGPARSVEQRCRYRGFGFAPILTFRQPMVIKEDLVFRAGLVTFVGFVLWRNIEALLHHETTIETYGFAVLLCSLGYVAARRALDRDQQLNSIQQELEVARRIQLSILPAAFAASEHFTVAARFVPMTSVAGDFYEFIYPENGTVGLLIADVSGTAYRRH